MAEYILPKGTVVTLMGIPCELMEDTTITSATIDAYGGLDNLKKNMNPRTGDGTELNLNPLFSG